MAVNPSASTAGAFIDVIRMDLKPPGDPIKTLARPNRFVGYLLLTICLALSSDNAKTRLLSFALVSERWTCGV